MKALRNAAILIGLAAYLAAFYLTSLPDFRTDAGAPMERWQLVDVLLFRAQEALFPNWFGSPAQFTFSDRLPVLLVAGLILAWAAAVGWLLLVACQVNRGLKRLETFVFSLGVGLAAVSMWVLAFGLAGSLFRLSLFTIPAIATFAAAACVWLHYRRQAADQRRLAAAGLATRVVGEDSRGALPPGYLAKENGRYDPIPKRWLWWAMPFVAAIVLAAMLPPVDFDVREYHLQAPKEFFQQGRITFLPHNVYANMPLGAEMLSLLAMVISGDWWWGALAGKTVIAAFTPLCALALFAAGRRFHSASAGIVAALAYISIPWIVSVSSLGLVEGVSACYLFLAIYAMLLAMGDASASHPVTAIGERFPNCPVGFLLLAGFLSGGAVAVKYPALLFVLIPLAAWAFIGLMWGRGTGDGGRGRVASGQWSVTSETNPKSLRPSAAFGLSIFLLAAMLACGLWFGKNLAFTGNPTYPLLYDVFGGKTWNTEKDAQWNRVHRPDDFSLETLGTDMRTVFLTSQWLSPLIVPLAVLAFVGWSRRSRPSAAWHRLVGWLGGYVLFVIAAWWLFTHRIDRFWIPALPVLALLAGMGACWNAAAWWRRLLKVLLLVCLSANFLIASAGWNNAWFVPLDQLRDETPRWISLWHWHFNHDLNRGAVLLVGDVAPFDLKPRTFYNTCFDDCLFERWVKGKTAQEIRSELASRKIAYVFVDWSEINRYRDTYGFTNFVQPEVFDQLVEQGILEPMPPLPNQFQRAYRVKEAGSAWQRITTSTF